MIPTIGTPPPPASSTKGGDIKTLAAAAAANPGEWVSIPLGDRNPSGVHAHVLQELGRVLGAEMAVRNQTIYARVPRKD